MADKVSKYIDGVGWRCDIEHTMLRRAGFHDYTSRCIYMLTLTLADRRHHALGELRWKEEAPGRESTKAELSRTAPGVGDDGWHGGAADGGPAGAGGDGQSTKAELSRTGPYAAPGLAPGVGSGLAPGVGSGLAPGVDGGVRGSSAAMLVPTALGKAVEREWRALGLEYPQVSIIRLQLMPEHLHVVVFVHDTLPMPLGKLVGIVKNRCNKHYWQALTAQGLLAPKGQQTPPPLFSENFQDSILTHDGQLDAMVNYVEQNPYRALVKQAHPDLFRVVSELTLNGQTFAAIGNRWLLDRPLKLQVRCHNNTTAENLRLIARQKAYFLMRGEKGGVVVSPCISAGEKEIARAALDEGFPLIVILENGFPPMYKPPGKYFEACANGRLLMLAPWPYHTDHRTITRQQCLSLNDIALHISTEPWTRHMEDVLCRK